jgi:DGQHR domain-containing protein
MNDAVRIPVFQITQPIGEFFVGVINSVELLRICEFDYRRMQYNNGYMEFLGIQRKVDPKRIAKISDFVGTVDACFPSSIVISVDQKCAKLTKEGNIDYICVNPYIDPEDKTFSIALDQAASIIDGQHRLKGLELSGKNFELAITIFVGADDAMDALLFSRVNLAQTKVNRSLAYDLFALAHERSPEKTCHEITVALDEFELSPFKGLIKRLGVATEGRFGETLSQATIVAGILPYISDDPDGDRDRGKRFGFWEPISPKDHSRRIFFELFRRGDDSKIEHLILQGNTTRDDHANADGSLGVQAFEVFQVAVEEGILVVPLNLKRDDPGRQLAHMVDFMRDRFAGHAVNALLDREDRFAPIQVRQNMAQALGALGLSTAGANDLLDGN